MPTTKPDPGTRKPPGNRKVMVYVTANVHRAMGQVALEEDRRISSVYVEAARTFLEARGREVDLDPSPITSPSRLGHFGTRGGDRPAGKAHRGTSGRDRGNPGRRAA